MKHLLAPTAFALIALTVAAEARVTRIEISREGMGKLQDGGRNFLRRKELKIAIAGAGLTGAYLYRLLRNRSYEGELPAAGG